MDVNRTFGTEGDPAGAEAGATPSAPATSRAAAAGGADPAPASAPGTPNPARPRTKAGQREATTAALIAAARELFAERGYAAVATEEIVQRAGVTRGALYHHFRGGKEDVFRAVLVQISAETVQHIAHLAMRAEDPWESLVVGCEAFLDACASPDVQRIVLIDAPAVLGWDMRRAIDRDYGLGLLEAALQRAMDAGRIREGSAISLAYVLGGALDEAAMVVARADDPLAARAEMGQTVRRLLEGLRGT
jgi:AcrR family transcriptional regulator